MSGRGRPRRPNQGKRPARLQEELPASGAKGKRQRRTATTAATAQVHSSDSDSQGAWFDGAQDATRHDPRQQQGTDEGLFNRLRSLEEAANQARQDSEARIKALESALASQSASQKGQALDALSITVPPEIKERIALNKFVDLQVLSAKSFLDRPEEKALAFVQDEQGRLVPRLERRSKGDLTIDQWSSAFHVLMSVYLVRHPQQLQDMLAYAELIRGAARDNPGNAWALYDQQFRSRLEADPTRPWGMIDNQLWLQLFCKAAVAAPPSRPNPPAERKNTTQNPSQKGVCRFHNRPRGCQKEDCAYVHRCTGCNSTAHGLSLCTKKLAQGQSAEKGGPGAGQPFHFGTGQK